ncbi:MAG: serine/threonine protein kinase, partial [Leptothrix sp. (in: b-proteobacteria)]
MRPPATSTDCMHAASNLMKLDPAASSGRTTLRSFGRFSLKQLLGRSSLSMAWLAHDPRARLDVLLLISRHRVNDAAVLNETLSAMRRASRIEHPRLLVAIESGAHEAWPYLACECPNGAMTVSQYLTDRPPPAPLDSAGWCIDALEGLAYLHDAGLVHGDIGRHSLIVDRNGRIQVWGAGLAPVVPNEVPADEGGDVDALSPQRAASHRDLIAVGLLLFQWVAHAPALDEADLPSATKRLDQEIVRLPWSLPMPVPDALRAIINRAVDRNPRRRYLGARSLERALSGWRQVQSSERGGPLALLLDRLGSVGHLPALPGLAQRVTQLSRMESQRIDELTDVVLEDPALAFELLRNVNSAQVGLHADDTVTTVRRAIQLLGINGVRRAASVLRAWPGPLREPAVAALDQAMQYACLAGHLADVLSPAGLDAEGALLAAQLQHLGQLLVRYHFPDEALQIASLMQPTPALEPGGPSTPGLSEEAAAMAVLGVDLPSLANALAKHWGLTESVQVMMQPLSVRQLVHAPAQAEGWMRLVASCANETLNAFKHRSDNPIKALTQVANRYARTLGTTPDSLKEAMTQALS